VLPVRVLVPGRRARQRRVQPDRRDQYVLVMIVGCTAPALCGGAMSVLHAGQLWPARAEPEHVHAGVNGRADGAGLPIG
jgi:membrane protein implicated in regulation of membrane protease activity